MRGVITVARFLLRSSAIFDSNAGVTYPGYVAVEGDRILSVGEGDGGELVEGDTEVIDLGDRLVTPGLVDAHCFFNGWLLQHYGADLSEASTIEDAIGILRSSRHTDFLVGHGLPVDLAGVEESVIDAAFGDLPTVLVCVGAEEMVMNTAAEDRFGFTPSACWSEKAYLLLKAVMEDSEEATRLYRQYMRMMNSYGVTSTKEIGYDDTWFFDQARDLEEAGELTLRVSVMSQPVGRDADIEYGIRARESLEGDPMLSFSGYNQMTDGSISQNEGEMKEPYLDFDGTCSMDIDWGHHKDEVRRAEEAGFRFSLHAQGDGAVAHALDIFEGCERDEEGALRLRHAITDLEDADPVDFERMARLGVIAEVYPLIQSIADREGKLSMIAEKIGQVRGSHYWNRRGLIDAGVTLACATDLPMTVDDLGEGVYCACGGYFPEGGEPFNPQNMIAPAELLAAWTKGGAYDLMREDELGTLEPGKLADLAVFDTNVLKTDPREARTCRCVLTVVGGKVVYDAR
jgi:predicted amidohydrolase YtcJ